MHAHAGRSAAPSTLTIQQMPQQPANDHENHHPSFRTARLAATIASHVPLHIPEPLSMTRAAISSSSAMVAKVVGVGSWEGKEVGFEAVDTDGL